METGAGLAGTFEISQLLGALLSYTHIHRRYYSSAPTVLYPLTNDDDDLVSGQLHYVLTRRLALTFGATYETRRANNNYYDFNSVRVLAGLRGDF